MREAILTIIHNEPTLSMVAIGKRLGISKQRVHQIIHDLESKGLIENYLATKRKAKTVEKDARTYRKRIWRRMTYIAYRQRLRHIARINTYGFAKSNNSSVCQYDKCTRVVVARGYCRLHYATLRKHGVLWIRRASKLICCEHDCTYYVYARDRCQYHYKCYRLAHQNDSTLTASNTSGFRGVSWSKKDKIWRANIGVHGKLVYLGSTPTPEGAARLYDSAARKYHGCHAKLNFPNEVINDVRKIRKIRKPTAGRSGHTGVIWNASRKRWQIRIERNGKYVYRGSFLTIDTALAAQKAIN